jgi:hypothetical protein
VGGGRGRGRGLKQGHEERKQRKQGASVLTLDHLSNQPPRMNNQGVAAAQYVTSNEALLAPFKGEDIHGGPPVVLVERPGSGLADGERYYLGVLHYFKVGTSRRGVNFSAATKRATSGRACAALTSPAAWRWRHAAPAAPRLMHGTPPHPRIPPPPPPVPPWPQTFGEGAAKVKVYHHYLYKMEAAPPFRMCAVSKEVTLVTRKSSGQHK